ncbi:MAG: GNAT family N-acetyltransferase [Cyanobacteria bacterium J06623_7]
MDREYKDFKIRDWQPADREAAAKVIKTVLGEYGLPWQPELADRDVIEVETAYLQIGGEFWTIEHNSQIIGTAAYQPIERGQNAVEIRKMYLLPAARGMGLGWYLLLELEKAIAIKDYQEIWIETASSLKEAVRLYERNGYRPAEGVETARCDLVYLKQIHHN